MDVDLKYRVYPLLLQPELVASNIVVLASDNELQGIGASKLFTFLLPRGTLVIFADVSFSTKTGGSSLHRSCASFVRVPTFPVVVCCTASCRPAIFLDMTRPPVIETVHGIPASRSRYSCQCRPCHGYPTRALRIPSTSFQSVKRELFNSRCRFNAPSSRSRSTMPTFMVPTGPHQVAVQMQRRRVRRAPTLLRQHQQSSNSTCPAAGPRLSISPKFRRHPPVSSKPSYLLLRRCSPLPSAAVVCAEARASV